MLKFKFSLKINKIDRNILLFVRMKNEDHFVDILNYEPHLSKIYSSPKHSLSVINFQD